MTNFNLMQNLVGNIFCPSLKILSVCIPIEMNAKYHTAAVNVIASFAMCCYIVPYTTVFFSDLNTADIYNNFMKISGNITFTMLTALGGITAVLVFSTTALLLIRHCLNIWRGYITWRRMAR